MRWIISLLIAWTSISLSYAQEEDTNAFLLTTSAFLDKGVLPVLYTCDGKDQSPALSWENIPDKTQSLALIFSDPDAPKGTFYHWVIFNIPKSTTSLTEALNKAPAGANIGKNTFDKSQYNGPCPPKGTAHTYIFTLYALDTKLKLANGASPEEVMQAMQGHIIQKVELTAVYSRWIR